MKSKFRLITTKFSAQCNLDAVNSKMGLSSLNFSILRLKSGGKGGKGAVNLTKNESCPITMKTGTLDSLDAANSKIGPSSSNFLSRM